MSAACTLNRCTAAPLHRCTLHPCRVLALHDDCGDDRHECAHLDALRRPHARRAHRPSHTAVGRHVERACPSGQRRSGPPWPPRANNWQPPLARRCSAHWRGAVASRCRPSLLTARGPAIHPQGRPMRSASFPARRPGLSHLGAFFARVLPGSDYRRAGTVESDHRGDWTWAQPQRREAPTQAGPSSCSYGPSA